MLEGFPKTLSSPGPFLASLSPLGDQIPILGLIITIKMMIVVVVYICIGLYVLFHSHYI